MSAKIFFKKVLLVLLKILLSLVYAVVLVLTCFGIAVCFSSPITMLYLAIMQCLEKAVTLFNGNIFCIWALTTAIGFVPLLIFSVVYRIKQNIARKKALRSAIAKAKAEQQMKEQEAMRAEQKAKSDSIKQARNTASQKK